MNLPPLPIRLTGKNILEREFQVIRGLYEEAVLCALSDGRTNAWHCVATRKTELSRLTVTCLRSHA